MTATTPTTTQLWERFRTRLIFDRPSGFALDLSRLTYEEDFITMMEPRMQAAFRQMEQLEQGAIANPDEGRMVGHYWLRAPQRAPDPTLGAAIQTTIERIQGFAAAVHSGEIAPRPGERFLHLVVVGIGGSALGPQFVTQALTAGRDVMTASFLDNTDPDGMAQLLWSGIDLRTTLVVVISKSGGTKETRNGQQVAKAAFSAHGLAYQKHFVAVTGEGSELDQYAQREGWLARFPMWDWVGGRTSECSAVGLVPLALQGFNPLALLRGAADMDELTRCTETRRNPAAMLALAWYHCGCGKGNRDMVVLPYKDRLALFSRYLQQLVMESLGKECDLTGAAVHQGLAVYGNKGSTDQHAYVQQLRDGIHNFFVVFVEVLRDRCTRTPLPASAPDPALYEVEPGVRSGDYLTGFYLGTRQALYEKGRESITVTIPDVTEHSVGMLIALFERAVGLYASLINVNAYHQPGVEAGKKAAAAVLSVQARVAQVLNAADRALSAEEVAAAAQATEQVEVVFKILQHLAANGRVTVTQQADVCADCYARRS